MSLREEIALLRCGIEQRIETPGELLDQLKEISALSRAIECLVAVESGIDDPEKEDADEDPA